MTDLIVSGLLALLIGAVGVLSYNLGRKAEKNADFEKKKKELRCALDVTAQPHASPNSIRERMRKGEM